MNVNYMIILANIAIIIFIIGIALTFYMPQTIAQEERKQIEQDSLAWQIDLCNKTDCWIENPTVDRT